MAKNRVFFQFPAVNDSLDQLCRKREQQKAKRCCREQEQNFSHLPNSVKDKAEFCFQKCFHISRSDFRSISASILPHTAPKTRFSCSYHTMFLSFCNPHSAFFRKSTPSHLPKRSGKRRFFSRSSHKQSAWHRPRCSGKRRFLGKKALKDVTRRTGLLAQHIFPDASLLFFVLFSNKTKTPLSHATNFKKLYGKFFHYF